VVEHVPHSSAVDVGHGALAVAVGVVGVVVVVAAAVVFDRVEHGLDVQQ
jgi:hypothetical protein